MSARRVFILGGTGFMGQRVVRALAEAGHTVTGLARSDEKADHLRGLGATPVLGNAASPETYRAAIGHADVVINLASPPLSPSGSTKTWCRLSGPSWRSTPVPV